MNAKNFEQNTPFSDNGADDIEALLHYHIDHARQLRSAAVAELFQIARAGISARIHGLKQRWVAALDYQHTGPWYSGHGPFAPR